MASLLPDHLRMKGRDFIRAALALAAIPTANARMPGSGVAAAEALYGAEAVRQAKALAMAAGSLQAPDGWTSAAADWLLAVREASALGRLRGARAVRMSAPTATVISGATASWVAMGAPIPVGELAILADSLEQRSVGALTVLSKTALLLGGAALENTVRADLLRATSAAVDLAMLDPNGDGAADAPQSLVYGAPATEATGDLAADLESWFGDFEGDLGTAVIFHHPVTGAGLTSAAHPGIGARPGELCGLPTWPTRACPRGWLVAVDPTGLAVAEGEATVALATSASLRMSDGSGQPAELVSMFESNSVALRATVSANWSTQRPGSVSVLRLAGASS